MFGVLKSIVGPVAGLASSYIEVKRQFKKLRLLKMARLLQVK